MKREVDLLHGPISKTLIQLSLPIMATSLIQMAYNLIDMIWIGRLGSGAVAAVGAAGMYMWLANGITTLIRTGTQVKVGQSLGGNYQKAAINYSQCGLQLSIILGLLFGLFAILFHQPLISFFHLNSKDVIVQAEQYLMITCGLVVFSFVNQIFTGIMTARGNSQTPFVATCIGLLINLVLDPLFIFGFGIFPKLKVIGAGMATVFAQFIVMVIFCLVARKDFDIFRNIHLKEKMKQKEIKEIFRIGVPMGVQSMIFTGISMIIARLIASWGDNAVAAQKIGSQIESISWMSAEGFGAAINVFVAQNIGAKNLERVKIGLKKALTMVSIWGIFCSFVLIVFPETIFHIFLNDPSTLLIGKNYLIILGYSQLFMCIEITIAGAFSGFGNTLPPSLVGIVFTSARIPLAMALSSTFLKLNGIWWSITISSIFKGVILSIWFMIFLKKYHEKQNEIE